MESPLFTHSKPNDPSQVDHFRCEMEFAGVFFLQPISLYTLPIPKQASVARRVMSARIVPGSSAALMAHGKSYLRGNKEVSLRTKDWISSCFSHSTAEQAESDVTHVLHVSL